MNEKEFAELAAGYALHALSDEDERAFLGALTEHPEWEHHLLGDQAVVAALAEQTAEVSPPEGARAGLMALIMTAPQHAPPADDRRETRARAGADAPVAPSRGRTRSRGLGRRAWFALAASVALLVGVGAGATIVAQQLDRPAAVVALDRIEAAPDAQSATTTLPSGGEATVHWSQSVGDVVLVSEGLPPIEPDQSYELWFVRGEEPIPAGVFAAGEGGTATAVFTAEMAPGDVVAVTVEPQGGSPTGLPSGPPILVIPTA